MSRRRAGVRPGQLPRALARRALVPVLLSALALVPVPHPPADAATSAEDRQGSAPEATGLVVSQVLGLRRFGASGLGPGTSPVGPGMSHGGPGTSHVADRSRTALWDWPLAGLPPVARPFDPPAQRWLPGHRGIDLAGVAGERVLAVDAGVVTFSGEVAGVGMVSVTHESGLRSTYQPVEGGVARGERVRRGQTIGVLASTASHCALADCLHLGAVRGRDDYVDPLPLLLDVRLTLLAVEP